MKKIKAFLSIILSVSILSLNGVLLLPASAEEEITVEIDGTKLDFDVEPQIIDGCTMVPLRKIFEELGAVVKWDNDTKTVLARKNSKTVNLTIGSYDMQLDKGDTDADGNPITETTALEVPAQVIDDRTLVPARAISEAFGLNVDWDDTVKKVIITSSSDDDDSWKENASEINLSDLSVSGEGVTIEGNQITITKGGDYTITGTLSNGNIIVKSDDKVKLRLSGATITSESEPCIYIEEADKAYITITDGTKNSLTAQNAKGAIYSKENLEIKGGGTLNIEADEHGIKASDNLTIENGIININAKGDGIHINDTFKMSEGTLNISSVGDGIDSESIVIIQDGTVNVETLGKPIETEKSTTATDVTTTLEKMPGRFTEQKTEIEFESSTKGINAEWMLCIYGGDININSADHAIHCADEIEITGGNINLSSTYAKGISGHGNVTVDGENTVIDVAKSTEGIESKNILTINNGKIDIISTDDAINATGGNSGEMMGMGGQGGGMNRNPQGNIQQGEAMAPPQMPSGENMMPPENMQTPPEFDAENQNAQMPQGNRGNRKNQNEENTTDAAIPDNQQMQQGGNHGGMMGGMGRNMKDCLVITGGTITVSAGDDCLDSNGNLIVNGGTIKAVKTNGTVTGIESVFDPDGQLAISEGVTIVAAATRSENNINISQNSITVYGEQTNSAGDAIVLTNSAGNTLIYYSPADSYSMVYITSPLLETGNSYTVKMGANSYNAEITEQKTIIGTQPTNTGRFAR